MTRKVTIWETVIPLWLVVTLLIGLGAGAAAGTVLSGKVTGEINVAASQALTVGKPISAYEDESNRFIGVTSDDQTGFQVASEISVGEKVVFYLPIANHSDVDLVGEISLILPCGLTAEVEGVGPEIEAVVQHKQNRWKFRATADSTKCLNELLETMFDELQSLSNAEWSQIATLWMAQWMSLAPAERQDMIDELMSMLSPAELSDLLSELIRDRPAGWLDHLVDLIQQQKMADAFQWIGPDRLQILIQMLAGMIDEAEFGRMVKTLHQSMPYNLSVMYGLGLLRVTVAAADDLQPGYYKVTGVLKQISY